MRCPRTIITVVGLALTSISAMFDTAAADPVPPPFPATLLGVEAGEAGPAHEVFEAEVDGDQVWEVARVSSDHTIVDVERAPDGTVFFATVAGDSHEIRRLAPTEQAHYPVAEGWAPAVSPDGRFLAFAYFPADGDMCAGNGIGVLDLASNDVRRFPGPPVDSTGCRCPDVPGFIGHLAWAPDSRRLAFEYEDATTGAVRLLDTAVAQTLEDAPVLDPARQFSHPAWLADGRIAVVEPDQDGVHGLTIKAVDPDTGRVTMFAASDWLDGSVNRVDADASGRHLLASVDGIPPSHTPRVFILREFRATEELDQAWAVAVW